MTDAIRNATGIDRSANTQALRQNQVWQQQWEKAFLEQQTLSQTTGRFDAENAVSQGNETPQRERPWENEILRTRLESAIQGDSKNVNPPAQTQTRTLPSTAQLLEMRALPPSGAIASQNNAAVSTSPAKPALNAAKAAPMQPGQLPESVKVTLWLTQSGVKVVIRQSNQGDRSHAVRPHHVVDTVKRILAEAGVTVSEIVLNGESIWQPPQASHRRV